MVDANADIAAAREGIEQVGATGRRLLNEGTRTAREFGEKSMDYAGELTNGLADFVRKQPLIAVAGAFMVGYLAARLLRNVSA